MSKLDFEEIPSYMLSVRAQDSKTGSSSIANVHVHVQDINDNAPVFEGSPYFVKVKESTAVGTRLLRVYTSDRDSGENQRRSYEILSDTSVIPGVFEISEDTGILRIEKKLDYEVQKQCDVVVRVTDHGQPSLSAEAIVTVILTFLVTITMLTCLICRVYKKRQPLKVPLNFFLLLAQLREL